MTAGDAAASFCLAVCPGVGPIVLAEPVHPSAEDALQKAKGVGHAGRVRGGVVRCGLVFLGRICVLVPLTLRDRWWVSFPDLDFDRLASCQAEFVCAHAAGSPQHAYRCDRGVAVADMFSLHEGSGQEVETGA